MCLFFFFFLSLNHLRDKPQCATSGQSPRQQWEGSVFWPCLKSYTFWRGKARSRPSSTIRRRTGHLGRAKEGLWKQKATKQEENLKKLTKGLLNLLLREPLWWLLLLFLPASWITFISTVPAFRRAQASHSWTRMVIVRELRQRLCWCWLSLFYQHLANTVFFLILHMAPEKPFLILFIFQLT